MSLAAGTLLGPYKVLSLIGAGGMGEVYKARDTRLDRTVAIKVLPSHLSDNAELKQRLEREARTISGLSHPHICTLYDIGSQEGFDFLVMEYLDGETLADRLKRGALPLDQALEYGIEISDALDKAHRQGVVHRDLKPGNIMITKEGTKLLDFGLAKFKADVSTDPSSVLSALPTEEKPLTGKGAILGTLQYMAPEQLEGKEADARTDIFASGAVLYEMLTGQKPFEGKSQASLISAIMSSEPRPVSELQPLSPPLLERMIKKCLAKDPEDRWQSALDLRDGLKWIAVKDAQDTALAGAGDRTKSWHRLGVAMLTGLLLGALAVWQLKPSPQPDLVTRFSVTLPPTEQFTSQSLPAVALSPRGDQLVYVANEQLYLRHMDQMESSPIRGTDETGVEARNPFFSPDGRWLGFWAGQDLKKVPVTGGTPVTLCENIVGRNGASWGPDDTIVFGDSVQGILQVNATGGTPELLIPLDPDKGESILADPQILPDGETILFTVAHSGGWDEAQIVVQSLATGERTVLVEGGSGARYVPTGHLIYAVGETLLAVLFDLHRLRVTGGPVSWIDDVAPASSAGAAHFSHSNSGSFAYIPVETYFDTGSTWTLGWVDRLGRSDQMTEIPVVEGSFPRISPDGGRLAVVQMSEAFRFDIWVHDLERGTRLRITHEGRYNLWPVWSPDGARIAFASNRSGTFDIFWKSADGSGEAEPILTSGNRLCPNSWSSDGRFLAFWERTSEGRDILILPMDGERTPQPLVATRYNEWLPTFSPDGRWLAYVSDESGQAEVYVQPFPGPGGKQPISTGGGSEPVWSSDGRELFYVNGEQILAVAMENREEGSIGKPQLLIEIPNLIVTPRYYSYDASPDGQKFVVVKRGESDSPAQMNFAAQMHFVLNGFEELRRLAPPGH